MVCVAVVIYGVMMNEPIGRVTEGPATSDVGSLAGSPLLAENSRDVRTGLTLQEMQKRRIELLEWARQISSGQL